MPKAEPKISGIVKMFLAAPFSLKTVYKYPLYQRSLCLKEGKNSVGFSSRTVASLMNTTFNGILTVYSKSSRTELHSNLYLLNTQPYAPQPYPEIIEEIPKRVSAFWIRR